MEKENKEREVKIEGFGYLLEPKEKIIGVITESKNKWALIFKPKKSYQFINFLLCLKGSKAKFNRGEVKNGRN
jgi:hypothetical protein